MRAFGSFKNTIDEDGMIVPADGNYKPMEEEPEDVDDEDKLVERIRELFVDENLNSMQVCIQLHIPLTRFNHLIQKYDISKFRSSGDENFGAGE